ncbi:MAG TPA: hypothetical protein VFX28_12995, partial [Methylomirabilota bacterium]|nr:hypothetical protein [Methylomirabilota bacterium]
PAAERARRDHRHTLGELAYLRLDYAFMRHGPWEATASYSFFQTINQDLPEFNVQNHLGAVSGLYRGEAGDWPYQLGLAYAYDYFTLDDDEFVQRHTAGLLALLAAGPRHLSALQARLQVKEFSDDTRGTIDTAEVRDAHNWMVGLLHVLRFDGDRHLLRGGWQVDVEDAEGRNFSYLGHRFLVGGQYTLPWGGTRLRYDGDLHLRDYRHAHTLLPESRPRSRERHDRELTHVVRIEQPLPWSLTLIAEYQAIIARSNLPLYSFTRNLYTLNVSWQY